MVQAIPGRFRRRESVTAYLFLMPSILFFLFFVFVPAITVVYLSFQRYNIITPAQGIGIRNWSRLLSDQRLWTTMRNTAKYVALIVPMHMLMSLLLAFSVASIKKSSIAYLFRTVYYFPTLVTTSAVAIAWTYILNTDLGMLNYYLGRIGITKIQWINSSFWVYPTTMIFSLWKFSGNYFLYMYVGVRNIDQSLIEAAEIDGANRRQVVRHVALPMLTPTLFFVLVTQLIGCIQIFEEPYLITRGGPGDASRSISQYIYSTAYSSQNYGYACAISLMLLTIILLITLIQFKGSHSWVTYDRE